MSTPDTRAAYLEYLASDHWARLKIEAAARWGERCLICGRNPVEWHHIVYRHPWTDCTTDDVIPVCHDHHKGAHFKGRIRWLLSRARNNDERRAILKRELLRIQHLSEHSYGEAKRSFAAFNARRGRFNRMRLANKIGIDPNNDILRRAKEIKDFPKPKKMLGPWPPVSMQCYSFRGPEVSH